MAAWLAAAAVVGAAGYAVAGQFGLFVVAAAAAVVAVVVVRVRIPAAPSRPAGASVARFLNEAFPAFRHIDYNLGEAGVSRRHFDHGARPLLVRLLAALLASRRRTSLAADPAAARAALGDDLWPLLDPARPVSMDSRAPGVSAATLAQITDRLEGL